MKSNTERKWFSQTVQTSTEVHNSMTICTYILENDWHFQVTYNQ